MFSSVLRRTFVRNTVTHVSRRMASSVAPSASKVWPWVVGAAATSGAVTYWYGSQGSVGPNKALSATKDAARTKVDEKTIKEAFDRLQKVLPSGHVTSDLDALQFHGYTTNSYHNEGISNIVVYPQNTQHVVDIVKIANELK